MSDYELLMQPEAEHEGIRSEYYYLFDLNYEIHI